MGKVKSLLLISRPIFWPSYIFLYVPAIINVESLTWIHFLGFIFITFPLGLITCGLNDIADRESDLQNKRKGGWEGHILSEKEVRPLILIIGITSSLFIFLFLFIGRFNTSAVIFLMVVLSYLYSFKPFRFKSKPFLDSLTLGVGLLLIYLFGKSLVIDNFIDLFRIPLVVWLIIFGAIALHSVSTLWDLETDRKLGDRTTGVFLGKRGTLAFAEIVLGFIFLRSLTFPFFIQFYLLSNIIVTLLMFIKPTEKLIHGGTWIMMVGFVLLCVYLLIFELSFVRQSLAV